MEKPKEFWIYAIEASTFKTHRAKRPINEVKNIYKWHDSEVQEWHVIEKAAYDLVLQALKMIEQGHHRTRDAELLARVVLADLGELK